MFKKILLVLMIGCFLFGMATKAEVENVKEEVEKEAVTDTLAQTEKEGEKGYKIEVIKAKLRGEEEEIRFISPEGKVVKDIQLEYLVNKVGDLWHIESTNLGALSEDKSKVIISEKTRDSRYNPEGLTDYPGYEGEIWNYEVSLINNRGEVKFTKQFKTYPGDDPTASYWKTLFSKQGNTVLFFYRDSDHVFHIEVYDVDGNKLAEASNENYLSNLQISPDGKIVGAETEKKVGKAWLRHLFFLDVETGETKMVKAEGSNWDAGFGLSIFVDPNLPPKGKASIGWAIYDGPPRYSSKVIEQGYKYLTFDEIPSDITMLFGVE